MSRRDLHRLRGGGEMGRGPEYYAYTSYPELSQMPQVYDLVQKEIIKMNRDLPAIARIKKFVNLYKEFDADDEELTRTRKFAGPLSKNGTKILSTASMLEKKISTWIRRSPMKTEGRSRSRPICE